MAAIRKELVVEPSGDLGGHRNGQYPAKSNNDQMADNSQYSTDVESAPGRSLVWSDDNELSCPVHSSSLKA